MDNPAERSVHVALCGNVYISPEYNAKRKPQIHTIFYNFLKKFQMFSNVYTNIFSF